MASNRPALTNTATGELKVQNITKHALLGGKPKGSNSKLRPRNEMYMEKLENAVSLSSKRKIESILSDVNNLGDVEKMLLYLRLPTGFSESEPTFTKSSPSGPNSSREEHTKAFNWICSHLEESLDTSMRKSDVYEDYKIYCESFKISAVCAADFGKIMKGVFPKMKRRRLGTRGNSRYCYSGIRKKADMKSPVLPQLDLSSSSTPKNSCQLCPDHQMLTAAAGVVCSWGRKSHSKEFGDIVQWAQHLIQEGHVPKESDTAKTFMSMVEESGGMKTPKLSHLDQESWLQRSPEERRRETTHQLQLKLQQKQFVKDQQRKEEEERRKSLGIQASEGSIDTIDTEAVVSQSKETMETTTPTGLASCSLTMTSPKPSGPNGIVPNSKEKESPKKKLTPIQPKNPRGNVCLIPVPFPPTDNQPLKLVYMPDGKKLAIPANMNLPGSQPLPGSPMVSSQVCQNTVTIQNKVIVPVSQIQLQASQFKTAPAAATIPATVPCSSNGQQQQVLDQPGTTISIQGSKVNQINSPSTTLMTLNSNQWNRQSKVINPGILSVLPANQVGLVRGLIPTDPAKGTPRTHVLTPGMVQGIRNNQKRTVIMPGNNLLSLPQTDNPPKNSLLNSGNLVGNDMMFIPNTISSNIPSSPLELVISRSNQTEQSQQKYLLSNRPVSSLPPENQQQSLATSVANLEELKAILSQAVSSPVERAVNPIQPSSSVQTKRINPTKPVLTRGNSLPTSGTATVQASSSQASKEVIHPSASNLLRTLTQLRRNDAVSASSKSGSQANDPQPQKLAAKDVKSSRLLEELLRPTPAKLAKAGATRKNPQPRPKSVAGMLENKLGNQGVTGGSGQAVDATSLYPSLSIHKKMNKMQTVSGMSAAMMLPPEFRGKLEQVAAEQQMGETAAVIQQESGNQMQVAINPQGGLTLITHQEGSVPGSPKIVMQIPVSSQSQLLSMLPRGSVPSSPQLMVGSPASNSGQFSSVPSSPLANLGSPEAMNSRSSNNTPMSEIGSVPASPSQPQQAQVFFVPINQGQGLDPDLISVNNKSPVKPKHRQVFFASNSPLATPVEAPLDLSGMHENVAAIQQQNAFLDGSSSSLIPAHLTRKRHHSGGVLMTMKASNQDLTRSPLQQQHQIVVTKSFVNAPPNMNMITNMPPPSRLPQMGLHLSKGKPIMGVRVGARGNSGYRKRNVSGPSISLQTGQQLVSAQQSDQRNIPISVSGASQVGKSDRERSLAKRSQSVPLPELSENLQNFIISTKIGEEITASDPEEIEKNLRKFEPIARRVGVASLNQFGAKRNLSSQLQSMVPTDAAEHRERSNEAILNDYLNDLTDSRDENENPTTANSIGASTSSQPEVPTSGIVWPTGLEQTLAQAQPAMSLVDPVNSADLELQAYSLDPFGNSGGTGNMPDFVTISPFSTSVTM